MGIKAHFLQDKDQEKFYPYAHADAVFDRNGEKVGDRLHEIDETIENIKNSNIQSDWNESDSSSNAYIKNKPTALPASDVSAWAKASTKPEYSWDEINGKPATFPPSSHNHDNATSTKDGFMSSEDKTKLDGIATGANKYVHPSYTAKSSGLYKVTVDATGHVSAASNVTKSDITALGIPGSDTNTWIALKGATTSAAGTAGYAPAPSAGSANRYLRSDGTWAVPPDTNTTYSNMIGASSDASGKAGLVPAPSAGKNTSFLCGDGTWAEVATTEEVLAILD